MRPALKMSIIFRANHSAAMSSMQRAAWSRVPARGSLKFTQPVIVYSRAAQEK